MTHSFRLFITGTLLSLSAGCTEESGQPASVQATCRIEEQTTRYQPAGSAGPLTDRLTYTYDAENRLLKTVATQGQTAQGSPVTTTTVNYQYDAEGYLTGTTAQLQFADGRRRATQLTYTFANGRLTGFTGQTSGSQVATENVTGTFEYDAAGQLIRQKTTRTYDYDPSVVPEVPTYPSGRQQVWSFSDGRLTEYVEVVNGTESRPAVIQQGLITRLNRADGYSTYQYDGQGRLTRAEVFSAGNVLHSAYTQEWEEGQLPAASLLVFKGFPANRSPLVDGLLGGLPELVSVRPEAQQGVLRRYAFLANPDGKGLVELARMTNTNQSNARQLVTQITSDLQDLTPGQTSPPTRRTTNYTYLNCP